MAKISILPFGANECYFSNCEKETEGMRVTGNQHVSALRPLPNSRRGRVRRKMSKLVGIGLG